MAPDLSKGKLKKIKKQQANAAERQRKATLKEAAKARDLLSKVRERATADEYRYTPEPPPN